MKSSLNDIVCGAKPNNRTRGHFECDLAWFVFVLISFVRMHGIIWRGGRGGGGAGRLKLGVQGQGGGRILDVDGQGGWGVLKTGQFSWTS